jgi:rhodanese-related sulfurtransferase
MTTQRVVAWLGTVAIVLAAGAAFAGSPYATTNGKIDVDQLARIVTREDDHVTAVELARWIRERRAALRVIDVRTAKEFDAFHIPTAERIPLDSLTKVRFSPSETVVLYSEGGAHAAQGWVFLRALGYDRVFFLRGGLNEWMEDVMSPTVRTTPTPADSIIADLSAYFGGTPQIGERQPAAVVRARRRGC